MTPRSRTRSSAGAVLLLNTVFAAGAAAQTASWMLAATHSPAGSLQRLPEAERAVIIKLLRPELGPLFQGDATSVADQAIRSFRAERINLAGISAVTVQPTGNDLCGASGNCSLWIVDPLHRRVLLRTVGVQGYSIDSAGPHLMPYIITATHESASEQERIRWTFVSNHYERQSCTTVDYTDENGTALPQPKITSHPCSPEDN